MTRAHIASVDLLIDGRSVVDPVIALGQQSQIARLGLETRGLRPRTFAVGAMASRAIFDIGRLARLDILRAGAEHGAGEYDRRCKKRCRRRSHKRFHKPQPLPSSLQWPANGRLVFDPNQATASESGLMGFP